MPTRYDYFKSVFSSSSTNMKRFNRRKKKTLHDIYALAACRDAWMNHTADAVEINGEQLYSGNWNDYIASIRGSEGATPDPEKDLLMRLTLLDSEAQANPGRAYENLGDLKRETRRHRENSGSHRFPERALQKQSLTIQSLF